MSNSKLMAVIAVAGLAGAVRAQSFTFVGIPPDATGSRVYAVSADGGVVAGFGLSSTNYNPGFTWTPGGGRVDFGLQGGLPPVTAAVGISGNGQVVVGSATGGAFRYSGPGTFQSLGVQAGYATSTAQGASQDGSVVVGMSLNPVGQSAQAFRWTQAGGFQPLGFTRPQDGGFHSEAKAVSRDGNVIVGYGQDAAGYLDAFTWTASAGFTVLQQLPGTPNPLSGAYATNFDGSIVVGFSGAIQAATVWRNGVPMSLGTIPGTGRSLAVGVSDDGLVIAATCSGPGPTVPCVWTQARGMEALDQYLSWSGVNLPTGTILRDIYAVSADGLSFGGWASAPDGSAQGFVARVPAPRASAVALFQLGASLGLRPRRQGERLR